MRRGLMRWDAEELPIEALQQRIARLQAAIARADLQAMLIYTNLVRPSAVSYLTGFTPYWSEGILLIGRAGAPIFATALSQRVAEWIRSVSPLGDIVNTPRPGAALGERVKADASARRVGILELDAFPAGSYDDFVAAAPAIEVVDATALFAEMRRGADAAEQRLLARADALATAALDQVEAGAMADAGAIAARLEKHARLAGAEEVYIAVAPHLAADRRMIGASAAGTLANCFAFRASVAYKGHWVRRARTFARDPQGRAAITRAEAWFMQVVSGLAPGKPVAEQVAVSCRTLSHAKLETWIAESCLGSYPLQAIASSRSAGNHGLAPGDFLVLTTSLTIDSRPWIGAAPIIVP